MSTPDQSVDNSANEPNAATPLVRADTARNDPNIIRRFDEYGREVLFPKEQWRTQYLPGLIKAQWDNPDGLYAVIAGALQDGFIADVLDAAERLHNIDPVPFRGAWTYSTALLKNGHMDEAERMLLEYVQQYGEHAAILSDLAAIYAGRNEAKKSDETLWHALELDPNLEGAVEWYESLQHRRYGERAALSALKRVAELPGSWCAQTRLARHELRAGNLEKAVGYYRDGLSRLRRVPADFLAHMSYDLGSHGHVKELLELTEPYYEIEAHGIQVGINLVKAHLHSGQRDPARRLVDRLYRFKRPEWRQALDYWDAQIHKAWVMYSASGSANLAQMELIVLDGPVWLEPHAPAAALFAAKQQQGPTIVFSGSSAELPDAVINASPELDDDLGCLSRALPLFLAEQVHFNLQARVKTLVPRVTGDVGMFPLSRSEWPEEKVLRSARESGGDYVVMTHLRPQTTPWTVDLKLLRTENGKCIGNLRAFFTFAAPGNAIQQFASHLLALLAERVKLEHKTPPPLYQLPDPVWFTSYALRLEQLLGLRCRARDRVPGTGGERKVIETSLQVARACPLNVPLRIILVETLWAARAVKPALLEEYSDRVMLLQEEFPLDGPAHEVVRGMLSAIGMT